ncbi:MAG: SprB repeat-containing protein, partial [Lewinellaceae bacterium]|nr:SprB repeat-containing protein [Lewinellaceae bacterium]
MKISYLSVLALLLCMPLLNAQHVFPAEVSKAEFLGRSRPLKDIPALPAGKRKEKLRRLFPKEVPNFTFNRPMPAPFADVAEPRNGDPLAGAGALRNPLHTVEPDTVWEGIGRNLAGVLPPDPVGDASPSHFLQMTNSSGGAYLRAYDKEGAILLEMPNLNSLWAEFNAQGNGDPIVLWDPLAERWLITERTSLFSGNDLLLVAISETSDPLGAWLAYRFQAQEFPDYPKYAVWHNAYIVTTNETGDDIPVYALEKEAMLAGSEEVEIYRLGIPKFGEGSDFQVATPVDFDGVNPPPPGSPAYVLRLYDDAWEGGQDKVELWEVHIDWLDAENTFLSGPIEVSGAPFELDLCSGGALFSCLPQPNGVRLDALQDIILNRAPYLNFGGHESILLHFAVDADGNNRAGLRWMELRRAGSTWALHQEGTYAPDDSLSRFAGGIAMDYNGNILMGYSVTSPDKEPSLRFTGRRLDDPPGEMTVEEYEFGFGLSSQLSNRWGDYASLSIDPANGKDFWFTGEYMKAGGNWGTRIMKAHLREDSTDVGPRALLRPASSAYLSDAEPVQVAVRNFGLKAVSGISVSYSVDGGPLTTELIPISILPQEEYQHTFSATANLEALGPHDFLIFTSLPGDSARFNDTLRTTVFQLPRNDAAITDIKGLEGPVCDTFRMVGITLTNAGADTLYSAVVSYQLNGGGVMQENWTGSLPSGHSEIISILLGPLSDGSNTFSANIAFPNGLPDENPDNDDKERSFTASLGNEEVILQLVTDEYPDETTWELIDEAGNLLYSGGPYSLGESLIEERFCLPDACYSLTLFDTFGDGLAGSSPGSFQIVDEEGQILALLNEINFGNEISLEFCSRFECRLALSGFVYYESAPGAGDGEILLSANNGIPPFEYSIDGGSTFQPSAEFTDLAAGTYAVVVRDANQCTADTLLELPACNLMASAEALNVSGPGQEDGAITLQVSGGTGDYSYSIDGLNFQAGNVFEGLAEGEYEVIIIDEGSGCEVSLQVVVGLMVGTEETAFFGRQVKIFPNPAEGYVRIEVRGASDVAFLPL